MLSVILFVSSEASADPVVDERIKEISAAISQGEAGNAKRLADAALASPHLSKQDQNVLLSNRALANDLIGETNEALADYTRATSSGALPRAELITALLERGLVLESLHRLKDAIRDYDEVLRVSPGLATALNNRAELYRRLNQMTLAQRDYLASLAANSTSPEHSYYGLGQIAQAQGNTSSARKYFEKALSANPDFALATEALAGLNRSVASAATPSVGEAVSL